MAPPPACLASAWTTNWHFIDNYSWKIGRHDIKFGYEFRRTSINIMQDSNFRGKLSFDDLTSFLEGLPSGGSQASGYTNRHESRTARDSTCRTASAGRSRLTVNFGLRWDYFGVPGEKNNLFYQLLPANGGTLVQVGAPGGPSSLYNPDYNNFAPRIAVRLRRDRQGDDGTSRRVRPVLRRLLAGHVPGPHSLQLHLLSRTCVHGRRRSADHLLPVRPADPIAAGVPVYVNGLRRWAASSASIPTFARLTCRTGTSTSSRQISNKIMAQLGYVGSKGTKLFRFRDINQPSQAQITAYDTGPSCSRLHVPQLSHRRLRLAAAMCRAPRIPNFFYVNQEESTRDLDLQRAAGEPPRERWHGLSTQANYVWSHSIDNASDLEDFIPNASQPNNSLAPQLERGNSNFDIRHRFSWNFTYQLPKFGGDRTPS